jgi:hypothetical protein
MDRFLTVNDSSGSAERRVSQDPGWAGLRDLGDSPDEPAPTEVAPPGSQGPCLYFGPQGQRCARPAIEGGFCARHQAGAVKAEPGRRGIPQIVGAGIGILAAMWPIVFDVLRAIIRWLHSH